MSPRSKARLAGVFEALEGFPAAFGQTVVVGMLVVSGDAAATAHRILTNEALFRLGFAIPLIAVGAHVAWITLFYQLFKPVARTVNLVAFVAMLVGCGVQAFATLPYLGALVVLQSGSALSAFNNAQQQDLAMFLISLSHQTFNTYLVFFGFWCVLAGYLITRSRFVPRVLGALLIADGIGWMLFLWPPLANSMYTVIAIVSASAEIPLLLWFLVFGVNNERWERQAIAPRELESAA